MPKEVIKLSARADMADIQRFLGKASPGRVILVIPRRHRLLRSVGNLALLRRWGEAAGREVVLVSSDSLLRQMAWRVGLPAYAFAWLVPKGPTRQVSGPRGLRRASGVEPKRSWWRELIAGVGFGLSLAGVFVAFVLFFIPQATITLVPAQEAVEAKFPLRAEVGLEGVEASTGRIPARAVEVALVASGQVSTVAEKDVPDAFAKGVVTFLNRGNTAIPVPMGALVSTSGGANVRFRTMGDVSIPAGVGSRAQVGVTCLLPGLAGNVPVGAINRVEGALGLQLAVQNTSPTSGGSVKKAGFVTEEDKKRLEASLSARLKQEGATELQNRLREGEILPLETIHIVSVSQSYDRGVGEEATALSMTIQVRAKAIALDSAQIKELAAWNLAKGLGAGFALREETISYKLGGALAVEEKSADFQATASAKSLARIDPAKVKAAVAGMRVEAARKKLSQDPALAKVSQVEVFPNWLGRIPWLYFRTQVFLRVE